MTNEMANDVFSCIASVSKKWKEAKRQADRQDRLSKRQIDRMSYSQPRTTIKDVVYDVLPEAYKLVSDNGKYYANARQLFYKVRPKVIEETEEPWNNSSYFTQQLLKDYLEDFSPNWKVVWDARGHIREPHTNETIGLGGVEVGDYIRGWHNDVDKYPDLLNSLLDTKGPEVRYGSVLFIEKEGFNEIIEESEISEKFDIGIMSTKGVPVGASCKLANALSKKGVKVYVLHDFDFAGFKIINTLRTGTRLSPGTPDVIDIGFRLDDAQDFEYEDFEYKQSKNPVDVLKSYGATDEECNFLVQRQPNGYRYFGKRVELNVMTSSQFIEHIIKKLNQLGAKKFIPDDEAINDAYTRAVYSQRINEKIEEIIEEMEEEKLNIPKGLREQLEEKIKGSRQAWDEIIWDIAEENEEENDSDE